MIRKCALFLAIPVLLQAAAAVPALAWSTDSGSGTSATGSQLSDPDDAVENFASPSADGRTTQLSVQAQGGGSAKTIQASPQPADAEPVNPGWPMWMVWHQN